MGCDIHGYIERKLKDAKDDWEGRWKLGTEVDHGRDYTFFGILNGVRDEQIALFPDRGFPEDVSSTVQQIYENWGPDAHSASYITKEEVEEILKTDRWFKISGVREKTQHEALLKSIKEGQPNWDLIYPYAKSTSMTNWVSFEMEVPMSAIGVKCEFENVLTEMNRFSEYDTRFVFWFDN